MSNSFQQLRRAKGLTSREVADAAGVSLAEEYLFEIGGIINKEARQKVMQAFQKLTGTIPEQPTTIMNTLGGPHAAPTGQDQQKKFTASRLRLAVTGCVMYFYSMGALYVTRKRKGSHTVPLYFRQAPREPNSTLAQWKHVFALCYLMDWSYER